MSAGIVNKDDLLTDPTNLKEINILNVCAIDNTTYPIQTRLHKKNHMSYLDDVENFCSDMFDDIAKFRSSTSYFVADGDE